MPADPLAQARPAKNEEPHGGARKPEPEDPPEAARNRLQESPPRGPKDRPANRAAGKGHNRLEEKKGTPDEREKPRPDKPTTDQSATERPEATPAKRPAAQPPRDATERDTPRRRRTRPKAERRADAKEVEEPASEAETAALIAKRLSIIGAASTIALSVVVLGISMPHLASGVSHITDCQFYTAIFMACVFDLSQIAAEYAVIVFPILGLASRRLQTVCGVIIFACTAVSMIMNVRAFLEHVETPFGIAMAYAWGCCLPVLVLLLVYLASAFVMRLQPQLSPHQALSHS